jgi:hypothetical protein
VSATTFLAASRFSHFLGGKSSQLICGLLSFKKSIIFMFCVSPPKKIFYVIDIKYKEKIKYFIIFKVA